MDQPEPSDDECIARTAAGDNSGFAELWQRHSRAAYTVARSYRTLDADDLVAESFAKVLRAIVKGGGPSIAFRAYLFTTLRNTAATQLAKAQPVSIERDLDLETATQLSVAGPDISADSAATKAFSALPQRWQHVLWFVGVEGMSPGEAAPLLGLSPNGVSALAMRARKRFRRELIIASTAELPSESACRSALLAKVGVATDSERSRRANDRSHVCEECNQCRSILGETGAIRTSLAVIVLIAAMGAGLATTFIAVTASTLTLAQRGGAENAAAPAPATSPMPVPVPVPATTVPATLAAAKVVVLTAAAAGVVALAVLVGSAITFEQTGSPSAGDVGGVSRQDPEPASGANREQQHAANQSILAAPRFSLISATESQLVEISGFGTPGRTVQAFVVKRPIEFDVGSALGPMTPYDTESCLRVVEEGSAWVYSTEPLTGASWNLVVTDLDAGDYAVLVMECVISDGETISSVFSTPVPFTIAP